MLNYSQIQAAVQTWFEARGNFSPEAKVRLRTLASGRVPGEPPNVVSEEDRLLTPYPFEVAAKEEDVEFAKLSGFHKAGMFILRLSRMALQNAELTAQDLAEPNRILYGEGELQILHVRERKEYKYGDRSFVYDVFVRGVR